MAQRSTDQSGAEGRSAAELISLIFPEVENSDERVRAFVEITFALVYTEDKHTRDNLACVLGGLAFRRSAACGAAESQFLHSIPAER